jgi:hypothetical protein
MVFLHAVGPPQAPRARHAPALGGHRAPQSYCHKHTLLYFLFAGIHKIADERQAVQDHKGRNSMNFIPFYCTLR